jgi:hypothetical protein
VLTEDPILDVEVTALAGRTSVEVKFEGELELLLLYIHEKEQTKR